MGGKWEGRGKKAGSGGEGGSRTPLWKGEDEDRYKRGGESVSEGMYVER